MASQSVRYATAKALGISPAYIPECLRNRLNGYLRNKTIPEAMIAEVPSSSDSHNYSPKPIRQGNHTYLRNVVFLDTLFDDPKIVKKIVLNKYSEEERKQVILGLKNLHIAKLDLLKSMIPMQDVILSFLQRGDIDWNSEEVPYPYQEGHNASPLIAANLSHERDLSIYDQTLKHFLNKDYRQALDLIESHPNEFIDSDSSLLRIVIEQKYTEYQEYADYLASFT